MFQNTKNEFQKYSDSQIFGDLPYLINRAKDNQRIGHHAHREEKIMYLETRDGHCVEPRKLEKPQAPTTDTAFYAKKEFGDSQLRNVAPISRYMTIVLHS